MPEPKDATALPSRTRLEQQAVAGLKGEGIHLASERQAVTGCRLSPSSVPRSASTSYEAECSRAKGASRKAKRVGNARFIEENGCDQSPNMHEEAAAEICGCCNSALMGQLVYKSTVQPRVESGGRC